MEIVKYSDDLTISSWCLSKVRLWKTLVYRGKVLLLCKLGVLIGLDPALQIVVPSLQSELSLLETYKADSSIHNRKPFYESISLPVSVFPSPMLLPPLLPL